MQNVSAYLDFLGADKLTGDKKSLLGMSRSASTDEKQQHSPDYGIRQPSTFVEANDDIAFTPAPQPGGELELAHMPAVEARVSFSVVPTSLSSRNGESASTDVEIETNVPLKECAHRFTTPDNDWGFRELLPSAKAREFVDETGTLTLKAHLVVHSRTFTIVRDRILAATTSRQHVDWIEILRQVNEHGAIAATAATKLGIAANNDHAFLLQAACKTNLDYSKLLVERGATLSVLDSCGRGPLFYAARSGRLDIVMWLIESGVELDSKDSEGRSAIFYACEEGLIFVVEALLAEGAEYSIADYDGDTPARLAESRGHDSIASMLRALQT